VLSWTVTSVCKESGALPKGPALFTSEDPEKKGYKLPIIPSRALVVTDEPVWPNHRAFAWLKNGENIAMVEVVVVVTIPTIKPIETQEMVTEAVVIPIPIIGHRRGCRHGK
jgi:hypothetical protein